jgi:hypothetical protein
MTAADIFLPTYSRGLGTPAASATRIGAETVVCATCGCRLTTHDTVDDYGLAGDRSWYHFAGRAGRDARGCLVACSESAHRVA